MRLLLIASHHANPPLFSTDPSISKYSVTLQARIGLLNIVGHPVQDLLGTKEVPKSAYYGSVDPFRVPSPQTFNTLAAPLPKHLYL